MSINLSHETEVGAVIFDNDIIYPNTYTIKINFAVITEDPSEQNIAIQRIIFFLEEIFDRSIFVKYNHPNLNRFSKLIKQDKFVILPEDPYDQIIGMLLYNKLSAITEGRFEINNIVIGGNMANNIFYTIDDFAEFDIDIVKAKKPYWWDRPDLTLSENKKTSLFLLSWDDLQLAWDGSSEDDELEVELDTLPNVIVLDGGEDMKDEG